MEDIISEFMMEYWLLITVISLAISVPVSALILMFSSRILKFKDKTFKTAIKVTLIIGAVAFVTEVISNTFLSFELMMVFGFVSFILVNTLLAIFLIKKFYKLKWKKTLKLWGVWFGLSMVVLLVLLPIIGFIIGFMHAMLIAMGQ